jgi:hypothetical protein
MPPQPSWFQRVPEIIALLGALPSPLLDRAAIEELFQLQRRQALKLMARFGGAVHGKTHLIYKEELVRWLEQVQSSEDYGRELRRKQKLATLLARAKQELKRGRVEVPVNPRIRLTTFETLSDGVHLRPGQLQIDFASQEDLLQKLVELSQAIMNDWERFRNLAAASQNESAVEDLVPM